MQELLSNSATSWFQLVIFNMAYSEPEGMSQKEPTKEKLSKLHCPFTWDMLDSVMRHSVIHFKNNKDDEIDDEEACTLEQLIKALLKCYKATLSADNDVAQSIQKAENLLMQLQQEKDSSSTIRAIEHVFYATKCFYLYEMEKMDELEEILNNIINIDSFNVAETGALYGCRSVVWSCLNDFGMDKAVDNAKRAVEMNQDCGLWHYILAKNLRRQRRIVNLSSEVTGLEERHFELAYAISTDNPVFGIYYLQMRIEKFYKFDRSRDYLMRKTANEKAVLQMAKNILRLKPASYKVLLRLALMFLRATTSDETLSAKECLDTVEEMVPNNSTFLHYTGMLYEECGEFRDALTCYKKSADHNNFVGELAYIRYGWETGELQPLPHLLRMLKKYDRSVKERQISMLLAIAIAYYSIHKDKENAAEYFLKALTIDPPSKKFKVFYKFFDFSAPSISSFLKDYFLYEIDRIKNPKLKETGLKIRALLDENANGNIDDLTRQMANVSTNSPDHRENSNN